MTTRHQMTVEITAQASAAIAGEAEAAHPRAVAKGTKSPAGSAVSAIVYSPLEAHVQWVEGELARAGAVLQLGRNVAHIIAALVTDPAPRPQMLVVDLDALSPGELLQLHEVRAQGWTGTIVALGTVPLALRTSLKITRSIPAPYVENALADEVTKLRAAVESKTTRIPTI